MCIILVREVPDFEFEYCPFFAVMKSFVEAYLTAVLFSGLRHSPSLRQDICQFLQSNRNHSNFVRARDVRFI